MENKTIVTAPSTVLGRRLFLLGTSAFVLAGCGGNLLGPGEPSQIYVLRPVSAAAAPAASVPWALQLLVPSATEAFNSNRIALTRGDTVLDYYANAVWPDRLPLLVQSALLDSFQDSGRIQAVSREQDSLYADYTLDIDVRDFSAHYADADSAPRIQIVLICQMAMARGRKVVANFTASQSAQASVNAVPDVVQAMDTALAAALAQITQWALAMPAPPAKTP